MRALLFLARLKTWGLVRSWFRRPVSAILTVLAVAMFIGVLYSLSMNSGEITDSMPFIYVGSISSVALLFFLVMMLFAKNRALVFLNDATFVLAGPFSKKEVLGYVLINDFIQNVWLTLGFTLYVMLFFQSALQTAENLFVFMFVISMVSLFAMFLSSYIYVLEATYPRAKTIKKVIFAIFGAVVAYVIYSQIQGRPYNFELIEVLVVNDVIHQIPVLGWMIQAFVSHAFGNSALFWQSISYFLGLNVIVGLLFFNFKGDFYEQSIQDSERVSEVIRSAKAGNETEVAMMNSKVKSKSVKFHVGYGALWSRYWLQARKTGQILRMNDIVFFLMYTFIARMSNSIMSYQVLLSMVVFISINPEIIVYELKRPYAFLIPEDNFKKLIMIVLPMLQRTVFIMLMGTVAMVLLFNQTIVQAVLIATSLLGIALILISGSVLTIYILKSKTNPIVEQLLRMVVILIAAIPAIIVVVILTLTFVPIDSPSWQLMYSFALLTSNLLVGGWIIYYCRNMLQGHDLFV